MAAKWAEESRPAVRTGFCDHAWGFAACGAGPDGVRRGKNRSDAGGFRRRTAECFERVSKEERNCFERADVCGGSDADVGLQMHREIDVPEKCAYLRTGLMDLESGKLGEFGGWDQEWESGVLR